MAGRRAAAPTSTPAQSRGRPEGPRLRLAVVVALLPAAAATVFALLVTAGAAPQQRLQLSALLRDWVLAAGCGLTGAALAALVVAAVHAGRWRRLVRHTADAAAEDAAADRHRLLGRLDHALKNPVMAMRAALATASAEAAETGAPTGRALHSLEEQVLRMGRLTTDLRKIADVEGGAVERRPLQVAEVVTEAVDVVRDVPAAAALEWAVDLPRAPWPLPVVEGDEELLVLAVVNLLDNAVKYTPPGGRIEVRGRERDGRVVVEVADTGPGIAADDVPHVLEELYRGTGAHGVPGSGLGLALVRAVVERLGGWVEVDSREGVGTALRLVLPAAAPAAGGPGAGAPTAGGPVAAAPVPVAGAQARA